MVAVEWLANMGEPEKMVTPRAPLPTDVQAAIARGDKLAAMNCCMARWAWV